MNVTQNERDDLLGGDRHIAEGEVRVAEQIARIERLRREGRDTQVAQSLLRMLEQALAQWREHRQSIIEATDNK